MDQVLYVKPVEKVTLELDGTPELAAADASLTSLLTEAIDSDGTNVAGSILGSPTSSGLVATVLAGPFTDGEDYRIRLSATGNSSGRIVAGSWEIRARKWHTGNS